MVKRIIGAFALLLSVSTARAQGKSVSFELGDAICQAYQGSWADEDRVGQPFDGGTVITCTVSDPAKAVCTIRDIDLVGVSGQRNGNPVLEVHSTTNHNAIAQVEAYGKGKGMLRFFNKYSKKGMQCFGNLYILDGTDRVSEKSRSSDDSSTKI